MNELNQLRSKWLEENVKWGSVAGDDDLLLFQKKNNVILPPDFAEYFKSLNGTGGECTDRLYEFYAIDRIKNIVDEFGQWNGIPNYRNLSNTLSDPRSLYVFANFNINLLAYAIRLYSFNSSQNEVFVICGDDYKKIANSFSEFLELYVRDSIDLTLI